MRNVFFGGIGVRWGAGFFFTRSCEAVLMVA